MPTTKRGKKTRSAGRRSVTRKGAGARRPKRSAPAARKKGTPRTVRARAKAATSGRRPKSAGARPAAAAAGSRELTALKARFQREKSALEKRLTNTVREIGQLRHHEARAAQLERQLKERDETIAQLRTQLSGLRTRELVPVEDEEVQPSLALGSRSADDLDAFEEDVESEDDELI